MKNSVLKTVSWVLLQSFCIQYLAEAAPVVKPLDFISSKKPAICFTLPASIAEIEDSYTDSDDQKLVYLIQDPHTNNSGQLNVAKTLDILFNSEKLKYIFLEAGSGDESLSFLRQFGSKEHRKIAAEALLRKAVFQGTEYLDVTSDHDLVLWGVENMDLYAKSVEAYKAAAKERERFSTHLKDIESTIKNLKSRIYFAELVTLDNAHEGFLKEELSLSEWAAVLVRKAEKLNLSIKDYENISSLLDLQKMEKDIDFQKANTEQAQAVLSLTEADRKEIESLSEQKKNTSKFTGNHDIAKAYFLLLQEKLASSANSFPELNKYFTYLNATKKLQAKGILKDVDNLTDAVYAKLSENEDQRMLIQADKMLSLLKKLFNLTLTPDEYETYKSLRNEMGLVKLEGFLNRKIMDLHAFYERTVFLETGYDKMLEHCEAFYELTYDRDKEFIRNMASKLQTENQEKAVLITGGFHTANLKHLLKEKNISYVSVTPAVLSETDWKRYESVMLGMNLPAPTAGIKAMTNMPMRVGARLSLGDNALVLLIANVLGTNKIQQAQISSLLTQQFPFNTNRKIAKVLQSHQVKQGIPQGVKQGAVTPVRSVGNADGARLPGSALETIDLIGTLEEARTVVSDEKSAEKLTARIADAEKDLETKSEGTRLSSKYTEIPLAEPREEIRAPFVERQALLKELDATKHNSQKRDELLAQLAQNYEKINQLYKIGGARLTSFKETAPKEKVSTANIASEETGEYQYDSLPIPIKVIVNKKGTVLVQRKRFLQEPFHDWFSFSRRLPENVNLRYAAGTIGSAIRKAQLKHGEQESSRLIAVGQKTSLKNAVPKPKTTGARLAAPSTDDEWRHSIRRALEDEFKTKGINVSFTDQDINSLIPLFKKLYKKDGDNEKTAAAVRRTFARKQINRSSQGMTDTKIWKDTIIELSSGARLVQSEYMKRSDIPDDERRIIEQAEFRLRTILENPNFTIHVSGLKNGFGPNGYKEAKTLMSLLQGENYERISKVFEANKEKLKNLQGIQFLYEWDDDQYFYDVQLSSGAWIRAGLGVTVNTVHKLLLVDLNDFGGNSLKSIEQIAGAMPYLSPEVDLQKAVRMVDGDAEGTYANYMLQNEGLNSRKVVQAITLNKPELAKTKNISSLLYRLPDEKSSHQLSLTDTQNSLPIGTLVTASFAGARLTTLKSHIIELLNDIDSLIETERGNTGIYRAKSSALAALYEYNLSVLKEYVGNLRVYTNDTALIKNLGHIAQMLYEILNTKHFIKQARMLNTTLPESKARALALKVLELLNVLSDIQIDLSQELKSSSGARLATMSVSDDLKQRIHDLTQETNALQKMLSADGNDPADADITQQIYGKEADIASLKQQLERIESGARLSSGEFNRDLIRARSSYNVAKTAAEAFILSAAVTGLIAYFNPSIFTILLASFSALLTPQHVLEWYVKGADLRELKKVLNAEQASRNKQTGARLGQAHLSEAQKKFLRDQKYIAIVAAPYAGKGTQLTWLEHEVNDGFTNPSDQFVRLEMGDYFRGALRVHQNKIGSEDPNYAEYKELRDLIVQVNSNDFDLMVSGQLMQSADQVVNRILSWPKYAKAHGILIDGFPRTIPQLNSLRHGNIVINGKPLLIKLTLLMDVSKVTLVRRAGNNRGDRPDANQVDARLATFEKDTEPVTEALRNEKGTIVINADDQIGPDGKALSLRDSIEAVREREIIPAIEAARKRELHAQWVDFDHMAGARLTSLLEFDKTELSNLVLLTSGVLRPLETFMMAWRVLEYSTLIEESVSLNRVLNTFELLKKNDTTSLSSQALSEAWAGLVKAINLLDISYRSKIIDLIQIYIQTHYDSLETSSIRGILRSNVNRRGVSSGVGIDQDSGGYMAIAVRALEDGARLAKRTPLNSLYIASVSDVEGLQVPTSLTFGLKKVRQMDGNVGTHYDLDLREQEARDGNIHLQYSVRLSYWGEGIFEVIVDKTGKLIEIKDNTHPNYAAARYIKRPVAHWIYTWLSRQPSWNKDALLKAWDAEYPSKPNEDSHFVKNPTFGLVFEGKRYGGESIGARLSDREQELSEYLTDYGLSMKTSTYGGVNYVSISYDLSYGREFVPPDGLIVPENIKRAFELQLYGFTSSFDKVSYRVDNPDNFEALTRVEKEVKQPFSMGARLSGYGPDVNRSGWEPRENVLSGANQARQARLQRLYVQRTSLNQKIAETSGDEREQLGIALHAITNEINRLEGEGTRLSIVDKKRISLSQVDQSKTILFVTGGGDSAGLNSAIASASQEARKNGLTLIGVENAFSKDNGLSSDKFGDHLILIDSEMADTIEDMPSTILGSSRFNPFKKGEETALQQLERNLQGFRGLIATGGDDTMTTVRNLTEKGYRAIAIPKSIDNDVSAQMIGFHTAWTHAQRVFWSTAASAATHKRASVVEIMGRNAGWLAYMAGNKYPDNSDDLPDGLKKSMEEVRDTVMILVPEKPTSISSIVAQAKAILAKHGSVNVLVAEGFSLNVQDPFWQDLLDHNPALKTKFEFLNRNTSVDEHGNIKLGGIREYIHAILLSYVYNSNDTSKVRLSEIGFELRGLVPDAYDTHLARIYGDTAAMVLSQGSAPSKAVVLKDGENALQQNAASIVDINEAVTRKTLNILSDEELRNAGVFWDASGARLPELIAKLQTLIDDANYAPLDKQLQAENLLDELPVSHREFYQNIYDEVLDVMDVAGDSDVNRRLGQFLKSIEGLAESADVIADPQRLREIKSVLQDAMLEKKLHIEITNAIAEQLHPYFQRLSGFEDEQIARAVVQRTLLKTRYAKNPRFHQRIFEEEVIDLFEATPILIGARLAEPTRIRQALEKEFKGYEFQITKDHVKQAEGFFSRATAYDDGFLARYIENQFSRRVRRWNIRGADRQSQALSSYLKELSGIEDSGARLATDDQPVFAVQPNARRILQTLNDTNDRRLTSIQKLWDRLKISEKSRKPYLEQIRPLLERGLIRVIPNAGFLKPDTFLYITEKGIQVLDYMAKQDRIRNSQSGKLSDSVRTLGKRAVDSTPTGLKFSRRRNFPRIIGARLTAETDPAVIEKIHTTFVGDDYLVGVKDVEVVRVLNNARETNETDKLSSPNATVFMHLHNIAASGSLEWSHNMGSKNKFAKNKADGAATYWLRRLYDKISWLKGIVVIGEGERDEAPMLYIGEKVGGGYDPHYAAKPETDIAMDVLELTNGVVSDKIQGSVSIAAYAGRGGLTQAPDIYISKWVVGPQARKSGVSVGNSTAKNLELLSASTGKKIGELKGALLLRPAHIRRIIELLDAGMDIASDPDLEDLRKKFNVFSGLKRRPKVDVNEIHGAQIELDQAYEKLDKKVKAVGIYQTGNLYLLADGDLTPTFALVDGKLDFITGRGGAPEGVLTATIVKAIGGEISARFVSAKALSEASLHADLDKDGLNFSEDERARLKEFGFASPDTKDSDLEEGQKKWDHIYDSSELVPTNDYEVIAAAVKSNPWIGMEQPHLDFKSGYYIGYTTRATGRGDVRVFKITYRTAISDLREKLKSNETSHAHYELGVAYLHYRFFDEAIQEFETAMRLEPKISKFEAAREHALAMKALVKGTDAAGNTVADIYATVLEGFEKSLEYSQVERDPRLHTREHLLDLYEFLGDEAKAKAEKLRDANQIAEATAVFQEAEQYYNDRLHKDPANDGLKAKARDIAHEMAELSEEFGARLAVNVPTGLEPVAMQLEAIAKQAQWSDPEAEIITTNVLDWLSASDEIVSNDHKVTIRRLVNTQDASKLKNGFLNKDGIIWPGTAGFRGPMENLGQGMVGPNYIGEVLMAQYADIYRSYFEKLRVDGNLSANAYAYAAGEVRLNTETYGRILLRGMAAAGVKVYYFFKPKEKPFTTPLTSHEAQFLTKKFGQSPVAGFTISASHNGLKDNGVKLFGSTGGQLLPEEVAAQIKPFKKAVNQIKPFPSDSTLENRNLVEELSDKDYEALLNEYFDANEKTFEPTFKDVIRKAADTGMKFVFTPLNGATGAETERFLTERIGLEKGRHFLVPDDETVLPQNDLKHKAWSRNNFDPASKGILDDTVRFAEANGIDMVMARDLDGDRYVIGVKTADGWKYLDGNQNGLLMLDDKLATLKAEGRQEDIDNFVMMRTHVTSPLLDTIAKGYGVKEENIGVVAVGFKYFGAVIMRKLGQWGRRYFGAEESYGISNGVDPEKDSLTGLVNMLLVASKAHVQGKNVYDSLLVLYTKFGFSGDVTTKVDILGQGPAEQQANKDKTLAALSKLTVGSVIDNRFKITSVVHDFVAPIFSPNTLNDGFRFYLQDLKTGKEIFLVIRPSGTEPVFKYCFFWAQPVKPQAGETIEQVIADTNAYLANDLSPSILQFFKDSWGISGARLSSEIDNTGVENEIPAVQPVDIKQIFEKAIENLRLPEAWGPAVNGKEYLSQSQISDMMDLRKGEQKLSYQSLLLSEDTVAAADSQYRNALLLLPLDNDTVNALLNKQVFQLSEPEVQAIANAAILRLADFPVDPNDKQWLNLTWIYKNMEILSQRKYVRPGAIASRPEITRSSWPIAMLQTKPFNFGRIGVNNSTPVDFHDLNTLPGVIIRSNEPGLSGWYVLGVNPNNSLNAIAVDIDGGFSTEVVEKAITDFNDQKEIYIFTAPATKLTETLKTLRETGIRKIYNLTSTQGIPGSHTLDVLTAAVATTEFGVEGLAKVLEGREGYSGIFIEPHVSLERFLNKQYAIRDTVTDKGKTLDIIEVVLRSERTIRDEDEETASNGHPSRILVFTASAGARLATSINAQIHNLKSIFNPHVKKGSHGSHASMVVYHLTLLKNAVDRSRTDEALEQLSSISIEAAQVQLDPDNRQKSKAALSEILKLLQQPPAVDRSAIKDTVLIPDRSRLKSSVQITRQHLEDELDGTSERWIRAVVRLDFRLLRENREVSSQELDAYYKLAANNNAAFSQLVKFFSATHKTKEDAEEAVKTAREQFPNLPVLVVYQDQVLDYLKSHNAALHVQFQPISEWLEVQLYEPKPAEATDTRGARLISAERNILEASLGTPQFRQTNFSRLLVRPQQPLNTETNDLKQYVASIYRAAKAEARNDRQLALLLQERVSIFTLKLEGSGSNRSVSLVEDGRVVITLSTEEADNMDLDSPEAVDAQIRGAASLVKSSIKRLDQELLPAQSGAVQGVTRLDLKSVNDALVDNEAFEDMMDILFGRMASERADFWVVTDGLTGERLNYVEKLITENPRIKTTDPGNSVAVARLVFVNDASETESLDGLQKNQIQIFVAGFSNGQLPNIIAALRSGVKAADIYSKYVKDGVISDKVEDKESRLNDLAELAKAFCQLSSVDGKLTAAELDDFFRGQGDRAFNAKFVLKPILMYLNDLGKALRLIKQNVDVSA